MGTFAAKYTVICPVPLRPEARERPPGNTRQAGLAWRYDELPFAEALAKPRRSELPFNVFAARRPRVQVNPICSAPSNGTIAS